MYIIHCITYYLNSNLDLDLNLQYSLIYYSFPLIDKYILRGMVIIFTENVKRIICLINVYSTKKDIYMV